LKEILTLVSKPVRYLGGEMNALKKDPAQVRLKFCLAFPDAYEVGMSHLGVQILYHILNGKREISCERAFAPWVDMEKLLREKQVDLCSLESSTPLRDFDIIGFSLQYELSFTNVLNMLDLSGIPFFSKDRDERFPLIIAGGPSAFNPAPVADFFDAMVVGDGEEVVLEISELALQWKEGEGRKEDLLKSLSTLEGVYVPSLHTGVEKIRKRVVSDLNLAPFPTCPIVPYMKVIHDRLSVEIARGCKRGCRFCEAGFINRPYRERSPERIKETIRASLKQTGYEEVSLLSLSTGDYSSIGPLLSSLMNRFEPEKVAVSFPSLRVESVVGSLAEEVRRVRKTGFTIAPEAGTDRLRRVINKDVDEAVLFQGLEDLFSMGWKNIKLYFMAGLPTEREEDLNGIIDLGKKISILGERKRVHPDVNVSVSTFVPKPHTPFQWASQVSREEMKEKLDFLRNQARQNRLHFKWQDPHLSFLEGVFSLGDRRLSSVLVEAHRLGCRFDGWSDQFQCGLWMEAFEKAGIDARFYSREKKREESLPWSFIETGVEPAYLWEEYQKGLGEELSPPCREGNCRRCGVCDGKTIRLREAPPAETSQQERVEKVRSRTKAVRRKIRMTFTKAGDSRFISHLELAHLFHRASRRAEIPLRYSEGFHPMPRIIFATALSVGIESLKETVDIELEGGLTPLEVKERLNRVLPEGIRILEAKEVPPFSPAPGVPPRSAYWITLDHLLSKEETKGRIKTALQKEEFFLHQERKGKQRRVDLLPLIEKMDVEERGEKSDGGSGWGVELVLRSVIGKTAKPSEIIEAALGLEGEALSRCRIVKME